jgi:hypothetical protein
VGLHGGFGEEELGGDLAIGPAPADQSGVFVVGEKHGIWGRAEQITGLHTGSAGLNGLSCGAAGDCSAGGSVYLGGCCYSSAFLVSEHHGIWGPAEPVPGLAQFSTDDAVDSVSCASAGDCTAGGAYGFSPTANPSAFVVSEKCGMWGRARPLPGQRS